MRTGRAVTGSPRTANRSQGTANINRYIKRLLTAVHSLDLDRKMR